MDFGSRDVIGCLTDLSRVKTETRLERARSKAKTGKRFDGGSFAVQGPCTGTWWEVLVWVLVRVASMASFVSSNHAVEDFQRRDGRAWRQSYHTTSKFR